MDKCVPLSERYPPVKACQYLLVGPWLWKQAKIKEEKEKCELRGRHSDCYWVEVRKRAKKMEWSKIKKEVG
jgi:hypothetical protein